MKNWSVLKTVVITILCLIFAVFLYGFIQIARYLHKTRVIETEQYCAEALMPAYADVSVRYGIVDGGYYAFETKKYKNLDKLGDALPAGCKQAVKDAVDNGVGLYKTDIKDEPVTRYEVPAKDLPLVQSNSESHYDCHYCVLEYPNHTYRFAIIIEMHTTR
ncbi:MAG: hypothetical protein IKG03_01905 [Clostridiales bacterium]|nr:hypothetical protein [Clostridiales bacterium]